MDLVNLSPMYFSIPKGVLSGLAYELKGINFTCISKTHDNFTTGYEVYRVIIFAMLIRQMKKNNIKIADNNKT